ncbi:MAG: T9SS type A sorting domain-containing protein [Bacteroidetes bacterium]|nr:T9SS type A sorting domain-containing protein [Bacteroidota bacterium]
MNKIYFLSVWIFFLVFLSPRQAQAQEFNFKTTTYYHRIGPDSLVSTGLTLASFNYSTASRTNDSLFTDGIYFPASDCFGRNLWIRVRHIAEDPNGKTVGINVSATASYPCMADIMIGGWAGFLYDFEIYRDINLTATRGYNLGALYPTSITVASLETLSGSCGSSEWLSFEIVNSNSTGWSLNSTKFTGINPNSKPAFSDTMKVYTTGGCYPPDGFTYSFPEGSDSVYSINGNSVGYSEYKMSAGSVSHFHYGYEYSGGSGGYQGMSMAFGSPPTYTLTANDVTCGHGNDGAIQVSISGGIGPFTYEWDNSGVAGNSITGLSSGQYKLTVTDQNGCGQIADTTISIHEPSGLTVVLDSFETDQINCGNSHDGFINLFVNGVAPILYEWNTGDTTAQLANLTVGVYAVTISDQNSCLLFIETMKALLTIDTTVSLTGNTIIANQQLATYQWLNCPGSSTITDSTERTFSPSADGSYQVAISKDGCFDTSACISFIKSGILEKYESNVSVYPNPTTGHVSVRLQKSYSEIEVQIRDMSGRLVSSQKASNNKEINLFLGCAPGIYLIYIDTNEGRMVRKVVKE